MINRKVFTVGLALAFLMLPVTRASEEDQATKLTFSESVQIPGRVLPAGTYLFTTDSNPGSKVVRIFSAGRTTLYATLLTASVEQLEPASKTEITLAGHGSQPEVVVTWFYPGRTVGHEFLYPRQQAKELAHDKQHTVTSGD